VELKETTCQGKAHKVNKPNENIKTIENFTECRVEDETRGSHFSGVVSRLSVHGLADVSWRVRGVKFSHRESPVGMRRVKFAPLCHRAHCWHSYTGWEEKNGLKCQRKWIPRENLSHIRGNKACNENVRNKLLRSLQKKPRLF